MTAHLDEVANLNDPSAGTASVTKALRLLDVFRAEGPSLGVSELARRSGLAKSTAFRLLALLEDADLVERDGREYRLSWRLFELGTSVQHRWPRGLRELAAPWLTEVHSRSGLVAQLLVLDGTDVIVLDKVSGPRTPRVPTSVGSRLPAHCTASGKAILAHSTAAVLAAVDVGPLARRTPYTITEPGRLRAELERVRSAGFAVDREEGCVGLVAVAAPIITGTRVIAAISVTGPAPSFDVTAQTTLVREAARRTAIELGADAAASFPGH